jgi:hypothetical protein
MPARRTRCRLADAGGAEGLKHGPASRGEVVPTRHGRDDRFHEGEAAHELGVTHGPVEAESGAPVVDDEGDPPQTERGDETGEVAGVIVEAIGDVGLVGVAHADQVDGDAATEVAHVREDVPPQIGGGGVAVKEEDRVALALVDVGHPGAEDIDEMLGVGEFGGNVMSVHDCSGAG